MADRVRSRRKMKTVQFVVILVKHLSNHMHFITNGFKRFSFLSGVNYVICLFLASWPIKHQIFSVILQGLSTPTPIAGMTMTHKLFFSLILQGLSTPTPVPGMTMTHKLFFSLILQVLSTPTPVPGMTMTHKLF